MKDNNMSDFKINENAEMQKAGKCGLKNRRPELYGILTGGRK